MVLDQRAGESSIEHLKKTNASAERRYTRRSLEPDEIRALLRAAQLAPERFGMTGSQRAMLYRLAIETGLRASELRSLTVSSFNLDNSEVNIEARNSKNRKACTLPLKPETAAILKDFFRGKTPGAEAFKMPTQYRTAKMLRADLADAGIQHEDESGRIIDFHSLRHTTGSLLAATGAHPKICQSLMRHSDINLTMSRYTHVFRGQESAAVANLPDLSISEQIATGTDGRTVGSGSGAYKKLAKKSDFDGNLNNPAATGWQSETDKNSLNPDNSKSLKTIPLGTKKEPMSPTGISSKATGPGRIRTCDQWIMSPLL